jgi:hypothetical protein
VTTQTKEKLTLMLISDGGFSEGISRIKRIIAAGQKWRTDHGFDPAVICAIGIENTKSKPWYPKPTDAVCQQGMREIGVEGEGGYFYVKRLSKTVAAKPTKKS